MYDVKNNVSFKVLWWMNHKQILRLIENLEGGSMLFHFSDGKMRHRATSSRSHVPQLLTAKHDSNYVNPSWIIFLLNTVFNLMFVFFEEWIASILLSKTKRIHFDQLTKQDLAAGKLVKTHKNKIGFRLLFFFPLTLPSPYSKNCLVLIHFLEKANF